MAMDRETQEQLRESLGHLLAEQDTRPLSQRLRDFGWDEALADDRGAALRVLFDLEGERLAASDALNATLAAALGDWLGDAALREATLVLAPSLRPADGVAQLEAGASALRGVALHNAGSEALVFPTPHGIAVAAGTTSLARAAIAGFDPELGLTAISGSIAPGEVLLHTGERARRAWESAVALARWLLAAELLGAGRRALADAIAYTKTRVQYGVAIGSFQALQHRCAAAHAALVGAGHVVVEASSTGSAWEALVAKALAGRAAEDACTQAQQCYGAIGFTWEQGLHRYLRRSYALDRLFGDYRSLEFEIGAALQAQRHVPRIGSIET